MTPTAFRARVAFAAVVSLCLTPPFAGPLVAAGESEVVIDGSELEKQIERSLQNPLRRLRFHAVSDLMKVPLAGTEGIELALESTSRLSPAEIYEQYIGSVLVIGARARCDECSGWHVKYGSAFAISDKLIATCRHLLDEEDAQIAAMDFRRELYAVRRIAALDRGHDLAVLEVQGPKLAPLPLAKATPNPGAEVTAIHHPGRHFYILTRGYVSRRSTRKGGGYAGESLEITADIDKGSSGAPIFDDRGNVVGVAREIEPVRLDEHMMPGSMTIHHATPVAFLADLVERASSPDYGKQDVASTAPRTREPYLFDIADFYGEDDPIVAACEKARRMERTLVVYFHAPLSLGCAAMEAALAAPDVKDLMDTRFACFRINQREYPGLAMHYGCAQVPFLIVFKPDGNVATFADTPLDAQALKKLLEEGLEIAGKTK